MPGQHPPGEWSKETYEASVTSGCWWYTPLDGGAWSDGIAADPEIRGLVEMERALAPVPPWAERLAREWIRFVAPCGHYAFPEPFLQVLSAMGAEDPTPFRRGCYTVDRARKRQVMDVCLCLDAWLAGAGPEAPAAELQALGARRGDWSAVCRDVWRVLGKHTPWKETLVERVLLNLRWWVKTCAWDDDNGTEFGRDEYLGDYAGRDEAGRPRIRLEASPRVQRLDAGLARTCPDWTWFRQWLFDEWWLCAPKAFRFLERGLWAIGQGRRWEPEERIPGFLQCEETYPSRERAAEWWVAFCDALAGWWREQPRAGPVADEVGRRLRASTPAKRWLVRLYLRKLRLLEANGEQLAQLVRVEI